jgi:uncharacterized protein YbjT (DUF2867 family)
MSAPILAVGGTGKLGRLVVARLIAEGQAVRVISRNAEAARSLLGPDVEVVAGNLADIPSLAPAFAGVERAFLLTPISAHLASLQIGFAQAAAAAGIERIVKISGSDWTITVPGASRAGAQHEQVEQELARLPFRSVSIRPNAWMQVSLPALVAIAASGKPLPARSGHAKVSYIDARDIADVAVNQLLAADVAPTPLVITGGEALDIGDVATRLSGLLGRQVLIEDNPPPVPFPAHFDAYEAAAVGEFLVQIRAGRAAATTDTVQRLLGRKPRTVLGFLAEALGKATLAA